MHHLLVCICSNFNYDSIALFYYTLLLEDLSIPFEAQSPFSQLITLPAEYVGSYTALNAALRKYRQCLCVQEDMQSKVPVLSVFV